MKSGISLRSVIPLLLTGLGVDGVQTSGADLGSSAPPLSISYWVKGKPIDLEAGRGTNIYVIEFWATWCPPCRTTIPNLTALQQKYKDKNVVLVGVTDEELAKVQPFVDSMSTNMNYTVALDREQKTSAAYLQAFGISTIPHAFIVDKSGKIVWHGNPMAGLDQTLDQVLTGKYDMDATRKSMKVQSLFQQYYMGAIAGQDTDELKKVGEELLTAATNMVGILHQFAHVVLTEQRIVTRQVDLALRASKSVFDATSGKHPVAAATYSRALFDNGKVQEAIEIAEQGLTHAKDQNSRNMLLSAVERYEKASSEKK
jgi:thiol-disulfide isomerase/thioredoxin